MNKWDVHESKQMMVVLQYSSRPARQRLLLRYHPGRFGGPAFGATALLHDSRPSINDISCSFSFFNSSKCSDRQRTICRVRLTRDLRPISEITPISFPTPTGDDGSYELVRTSMAEKATFTRCPQPSPPVRPRIDRRSTLHSHPT
mmetsp:Transcript_10416/g.20975  ORF Transcript_10416/g.20975 Transcript_10416/m.20975 type:complete len:145 (-) Transcript_10416:18-452(-)